MAKSTRGTWFVHCIEVICISESPLWEVLLYTCTLEIANYNVMLLYIFDYYSVDQSSLYNSSAVGTLLVSPTECWFHFN